MIDIVLTPRPEFAGIEITATADDGEQFATLTRTDANGSREVRLYAGQLASSSVAGVLTAVDTEAALTGAVKYAVTTTDRQVADATTTLENSLEGVAYLSPAVLTSGGIATGPVLDYGSDRPSRSMEFDVIGRSAPIFGLAPHGSRRVSLGVLTNDYSHARDIEERISGGVMQLRVLDPALAGWDMYFVPISLQVTPMTEGSERKRRWYVRIECVETDYPRDPLAGSYGWNIAKALELFPTIQDSIEEFDTIGEATRGPVEYV